MAEKSAHRGDPGGLHPGHLDALGDDLVKALDDGAGKDVDLLLDLNFNAKTEGYLKILRAIAHFDMFWIEIDTYNAEALGYIRRKASIRPSRRGPGFPEAIGVPRAQRSTKRSGVVRCRPGIHTCCPCPRVCAAPLCAAARTGARASAARIERIADRSDRANEVRLAALVELPAQAAD